MLIAKGNRENVEFKGNPHNADHGYPPDGGSVPGCLGPACQLLSSYLPPR